MRNFLLCLAAATASAALAAAPKTSVNWQSMGNSYDADGKPQYTQRITVKGNLDFPRMGFNMFARRMHTVNPADTLVEIFPGYYYIASPRLSSGADSVVTDIVTKAHLVNKCYAPDGFHRINSDGTTEGVAYSRQTISRPEQWQSGKRDKMVYGNTIYKQNQERNTGWKPGVYDVVPRYKKVTMLPGTSRVKDPVFVNINPENPEYYKITVRNDSLIVACRPDKQWAAMYPFAAKVLMPNEGKPLPNVEIENWPDMAWRGQHIDISRNYQTPDAMKTVLEIMAANHLNKLHFHFSDDEAWRLEIPGMPELTELASRRGYSTDGEKEYLYQIFAGDGNPNTMTGTANGYWTRDEFIEFIRQAHFLGIDVLPEIESPGHARAAIKAMESRHRRGDDRYRLIHDGDTSKYTSAQSYHDNVMNPALPGPYEFMGKVFDEIIAMYNEAGVPLLGIHIGGDEVPRGSWNGSSVTKEFMEKHGMKTEKEVHAYFVSQLSDMLKKRGVPMYGWEEVAVGHGHDFNAKVAPTVGGVHCWHDTPDAAVRAISEGFPVILSNVNRFYLDMSYSPHPEEQGLTWGGYVDEFDALHGYPSEMCPVNLDSVPGKLVGVQGQIWSETIRNPQQLYFMLLPKVLGLSERGWNNKPTWTDAEFNAIIGEKELPTYKRDGTRLSVHMRQPGITVENGMVLMNAPYSGGEIRYTTDGTEPNADSKLYTAPFKHVKGQDVRARYYRNGTESVTTFISPDQK